MNSASVLPSIRKGLPPRVSWISKLIADKNTPPTPNHQESILARDLPMAVVTQETQTDIKMSHLWDHAKQNKAVPVPTPVATIPTPPKPTTPAFDDLGTIIKFGKNDLSANPMSGSILKALLNSPGGYREHIEQGAKNGHTYCIWHVPPATNFTLCDKYVDKNGTPRTTYKFFTIKQESAPQKINNGPKVLDDMEQAIEEFLALNK